MLTSPLVNSMFLKTTSPDPAILILALLAFPSPEMAISPEPATSVHYINGKVVDTNVSAARNVDCKQIGSYGANSVNIA